MPLAVRAHDNGTANVVAAGPRDRDLLRRSAHSRRQQHYQLGDGSPPQSGDLSGGTRPPYRTSPFGPSAFVGGPFHNTRRPLLNLRVAATSLSNETSLKLLRWDPYSSPASTESARPSRTIAAARVMRLPEARSELSAASASPPTQVAT